MRNDQDAGRDGSRTAETETAGEHVHQTIDDEHLLDAGQKLGRYVVLHRLGSGGMSVVYAAFDGELDRKIAIKVMRMKHWDAEGQLRVLREAQAMARLSHPNVVSVHDVGSFGDQTFIAMELVEGETLKEWLAAGKRSWRTILDALIQAGRGIAAAHEAGLVHRDVKPANVLIDRTGRARVTDFGIARPAAGDDSSPRASDSRALSSETTLGSNDSSVTARTGRSALDTPLTHVGTVIGTPAYMAPEQKRGQSGPQADQFSFCVMAQEALCGIRERQPVDHSRDAVAPIPRWLRTAISRGLADDPDARFPSMNALLDAMTADPAPRRRLIASGGAAVVLTAGVALAVGFRSDPPPPCGGTEELARVTWTEARAREVKHAFETSGRSHGAATFARVDELIRARNARWSDRRRASCQATRVRHDQSEQLLDLRTRCLDRRLHELEALTATFAGQPDGQIVDRAIAAILSLPALESCDDDEALLQAYPPPHDPEARAAAERIDRRLDEVAAIGVTGNVTEALRLARAAAKDADALAWPPVQARAAYLVGRMETFSGDSAASEPTLERAMKLGAQARDDVLVAQAGLELIYVLGYDLARPAEALQTADLLTAMVQRAGNPPKLEAVLLERVGVVLWAKGAAAESQPYFERALALIAQVDDPGTLPASMHTNLGNALADQGRNEEAIPHYQAELAIVEKTVGAENPDTARARGNLASVLLDLGRLDEAKAEFASALALWEKTYGPDHPMIAMAATGLGTIHVKLGDPATGLTFCERAIKIGMATLPEGHPVRAHHQICAADALTELHRYGEAVEHYERALAIRTAAGVDVAGVKLALADALRKRDGR